MRSALKTNAKWPNVARHYFTCGLCWDTSVPSATRQLLTTVPTVQASSGLRAAQGRLVSTAGCGTRASLCSADSGHSQGWAEAAFICLHGKDFLFSLEAFCAVSTTANGSDWWESWSMCFFFLLHRSDVQLQLCQQSFPKFEMDARSEPAMSSRRESKPTLAQENQEGIVQILKPGCWDTILNQLKKVSTSEW